MSNKILVDSQSGLTINLDGLKKMLCLVGGSRGQAEVAVCGWWYLTR